MRFFRQEPTKLFWAMASICTLLAVLAGCVISPRRVVVNGPSPTPTPTGTPTPGTTPSPTPTPMAATVPKNSAQQFLFAASMDSPLISGFEINNDGSLAPVAGSPFLMIEPVRAVLSLHGNLIVAGGNSVKVFVVDSETGSIRFMDSAKISGISKLASDPTIDAVIATAPTGRVSLRLVQGKLQTQPDTLTPAQSESPQQAALDATDRFMYTVESDMAEVRAFRVDGKKLIPLSPASYPIQRGSASVALVEFKK